MVKDKKGKKKGKVVYLENVCREGGFGRVEEKECPTLERFVEMARENKWLVRDYSQDRVWIPHLSTMPIPRGMQQLSNSNSCVQVQVCTGDEENYLQYKLEEEERNKWYAQVLARKGETTLPNIPPEQSEAGESSYTTVAETETPLPDIPKVPEDESMPASKHFEAGESSSTTAETVPEQHEKVVPVPEQHEKVVPVPEQHEKVPEQHEKVVPVPKAEMVHEQAEAAVVANPLETFLAMKLDERELTESDLTFVNVVRARGRSVNIYQFMNGIQQGMGDIARRMDNNMNRMDNNMNRMENTLTEAVASLTRTVTDGFETIHKDLSEVNEVAQRVYLQRWIGSTYGRKCEDPISVKLKYTKDMNVERLAELCLKPDKEKDQERPGSTFLRVLPHKNQALCDLKKQNDILA